MGMLVLTSPQAVWPWTGSFCLLIYERRLITVILGGLAFDSTMNPFTHSKHLSTDCAGDEVLSKTRRCSFSGDLDSITGGCPDRTNPGDSVRFQTRMTTRQESGRAPGEDTELTNEEEEVCVCAHTLVHTLESG